MLVGGSHQGLLHCSSPPPNLPAWCRLSVSVVHTCHVCVSGAHVSCLCQWCTRVMSVSVVHTCHVCVSGAHVSCLCQWCTRVMSVSVVHTCHVCVSGAHMSCLCQWCTHVMSVSVVSNTQYRCLSLRHTAHKR